MSKTIGSKHHPLLIALAKGDPKLQRILLQHCDDSCIRLIAQIASNLLSGNIPVTRGQKSRLTTFKHILRELRHRGTNLKQKRKLLVKQKGGFLPFILPIVSAALGGLASRIFSK